MRPLASPRKKPRGPQRGRPAGTFTQHRRLDSLRAALEVAPRGLSVEEMAIALGTSTRSVRRYLRELDGTTKSDEKFETLESVETRPGGPLMWRIKPSERGRTVSLRRAQAYALLATRQVLDVLRGSALFDEIDLALVQIAQIAERPFRTARGEISGDHRLESRFVFAPHSSRSYVGRGDELDELFRAVADLRLIRYRPRGQRTERVVFHPYAMVMHEGSIFVIGRGKDEIEVLPLEAMGDVRTSETERFSLPPNFDVTHYLHGELGVRRPVKTRFMVEFDARVSDEVKARRFHPQQRTATAPDGRIRVSLPLVDPRAAIGFVLSWGDAARVVEPPELVAEIGTILSRAASRYA